MNNFLKRITLAAATIFFVSPFFALPPNAAELAILRALEAPQAIKAKVQELASRALDRFDRTQQPILQILQDVGFTILSTNCSIVCEHLELPGFIIKLPFIGLQWRGCNFHRILYAKEMRDFINQAGLNIKVPMKYACFVDLKDLSDEGVVVVAEKLDLSNPQPLTQRQYNDINTLIETLAFADCHGQNVFGLGNCVAIIDTETLAPSGNLADRKRSGKQNLRWTFGNNIRG